jgi:DNA mismatch repair protein MutL
MSRVALLSEIVASQVAAGEVIERPASIVKELVENSLDAQARSIEIAVQRGGIALVRVIDDGHGMDRDDALLCLERHATSKIRTGADLAAIATLGFRGEALPSIASVSRFRLATREPGALAGTEILVNGGRIETVRDCGEAPGTLVEARSLFYNLPARRKFLRSEATEAAHLETQIHLLAIAHPAVRFVYLRDGHTVLQLPAVKRLLDRIRDLSGEPAAMELAELNGRSTADGITIRGFIGKPGVSRATRNGQRVFINGRAVENGIVTQALREGYHTALMKGRFPVTYLFLEMDPATVDVNVHPAKREVRFREPGIVREALVAAVRRSLEAGRTDWTRSFHQPPLPQARFEPRIERPIEMPAAGAAVDQSHEIPRDLPMESIRAQSYFPALAGAPVEAVSAANDRRVPEPGPSEKAAGAGGSLPGLEAAGARVLTPGPDFMAEPKTPSAGQFKILGVLGRLYILMENAGGLVLVDQHAAHERILFEELRRRLEAHEVLSQKLLLPGTLQLNPRDADWLRQHLDALQKMGIGLEDFGAGSFKLDSLPPFLQAAEPLALVREIIDALQVAAASTSKLRLGEEMIAKTVCRHAVKANDRLREKELVRLIEDLLACELPYCCPHGRPTMIQMSYAELERKFGRRT